MTFTAEDANQNAATCAKNVRVLDTTAPSITTPSDLLNVECTQGMPRGATPALGTPAVSDAATALPW